MSREPSLILGLVAAVLNLLVVFGIPLTPEQDAAIQRAVEAALVLLITFGGAVWIRSRVTPRDGG